MKSTLQKTLSALNEGHFDIAFVGLLSLLKPFALASWVALSFWLTTKIYLTEENLMTFDGFISIVYICNAVVCGVYLLIKTFVMLDNLQTRWNQMHQKYQSYKPRKAKDNPTQIVFDEHDPYSLVFGEATESDILMDQFDDDYTLEEDDFAFEDEDLVLDDFTFDDEDVVGDEFFFEDDMDELFGTDGNEKPESRFD